jgi:hypothetical protein
MNTHLICNNPGCRFILDRRIDGESLDGVGKIVKECPECGSNWSSLCPFCERPLGATFVNELPHSVCCGRILRGEPLIA